MGTEHKIIISRAYIKAAYWQAILTLLISCGSLVIGGMSAALSALAGGGSVIIGGYVGLLVARRNNDGNPANILVTLLKAEAMKVLLIAFILLIVFKYYQGVVPLALILGLTFSALASGVGLRAANNENNE